MGFQVVHTVNWPWDPSEEINDTKALMVYSPGLIIKLSDTSKLKITANFSKMN